ncbi:TetR family transcriptional regulator [bacterium]|nr:TetR family transcriptional regulator [bacterium]
MKNLDRELGKFDDFSQKGKLKIDEICRKAAQVFSTKGYATATLADVSHAVGISKGGIYHYFSTKEELLFVILCRYMDHTLHELTNRLESTPKPHDKIRAFIEHHICHYRDNLDESRLILHESQNLPPNYWEIIKNKQKEYLGILRSAIENLIEGYEENPQKANVTAYSLMGMCNWPYTWFDPKGKVTPEELAEEIYKIFIGDLPIRKAQY